MRTGFGHRVRIDQALLGCVLSLLVLIAACGVETEVVYFGEGDIVDRDIEGGTNIVVGPLGQPPSCGFIARLYEGTTIRVLLSDGATEPAADEQLVPGVYVRVFVEENSVIEDSCPAGLAAELVEIQADRPAIRSGRVGSENS